MKYDYDKHLQAQDHVQVSTWICYKTRPVKSVQTKQWNQTLFALPHVSTHPYKGHPPVDFLFTWTDTIVIKYSDDAAKMRLHPEWDRQEDDLCLFVDDIWFVCNFFSGGVWWWLWPLIVPLKTIEVVFF
jgi:hypothetical protein